MLDGQGPDELFCGYTYLAPAAAAARLETGLLRDGPLALSDAWTTLAWGQRASGGALFRGAGSLLGSRLSRLPRPASRLLGPALLDVPPAQPDEHEREDLSRARALGDPLARRCAAEATVLHLPLLLRLEDRMSMAHSVEARVPFLDHRIVELASGLRPEIRVRGPWTKAVLRDAARGLVPLGVRRRRDKKGYPTPTARWFRGPLRAGLLERLTDGPAAHAGLLDPEGAKGLIARHARGEDHADALFRALSLDAWVGNVVVGMRLADIEAKHLSR
jgi:asparagine synthase (glutamine-hydrolysing)